MSQTERIYWIDAAIRERRYPNADKVSAHFGVSKRTAYADRDYLLNRLNAPLELDRERGGWYYTEATFVLPFLALSEREAAALRRALLAAQEYMGAADAQAARLLFERMSEYVPRTLEAESVGGSIHLSHAAQVEEGLLDACRRGVRSRQKLHLRYYGAHRDEISERVVRPYHLHYFQGEPHLIAWCEEKRDFRQFFLGRVQQWRLLEPDAAFARDADFDVDAYLRRGLGLQHGEPPATVRVRFSAYQARWIRERQYHPSQRTEEQADGGVIVTLHVAGRAEVSRWVLGFGAHAEVLEPAELRAEVASQAKKLAEIYNSAAE